MTDKYRQFYSFLSFFHEYFIFLESFLQISVKTHALFWHPYCWDTHDVLIVPADAVIPDINGALGVGLTAVTGFNTFAKSLFLLASQL
jgi:hypothetical protein